MNILGIGGLPNEGSAVLIRDGVIVAAVEESKVSRRRENRAVPDEAVRECLKLGDIAPEQVHTVAIARPFPHADLPLRLRAQFGQARIAMVEHHLAHAASAYYASPFTEATVLTLDRVGDLRCGSKWTGAGEVLTLESESFYPDSAGDLYSRVTELLGFTAGADEHKVQWLATGGTAAFEELFDALLGAGPNVDRSFLDAQNGFSAKFYAALGLADRAAIPKELRAVLASSVQASVTKMALRLAGSGKNLCLAGGLAYNALLVCAFEQSGQFEHVFVQPAAGNAGTALGAALSVLGKHADAGSYCLGPSYQPEEIKQVLENCKLQFRYLQTTDQVVGAALDALAENKIVAWMQGRMEYGPRALGNRSILASPLDPYSTENLNAYIKHREAFRKFAASVPEELASEYFTAGDNARYLATVGRVRAEHKQRFQAALLGDDLIRVHSVRREDNPLYWKLLQEAGRRTGLPVLYNTSFNLFGEPLVCTPRDAVRSFYSSGVDAMVVGNFALSK